MYMTSWSSQEAAEQVNKEVSLADGGGAANTQSQRIRYQIWPPGSAHRLA